MSELHLGHATQPHRGPNSIATVCWRLAQRRQLFARQHRDGNIACGDIAVKDIYSLQENTLQAIELARVAVYIPNGYTRPVTGTEEQVTVGRRIAAIRERRNMTQTELADVLKVRQPSVAKVEKSQGIPEIPTLFKYAKALSCSIEDFVAGVDTDYDSLRCDLASHAPHGGFGHHKGGSDVPASDASTQARLQQQLIEVVRERDAAMQAIVEMREYAEKIVALPLSRRIPGPESAATGPKARGGGKGHRKTHRRRSA